MIQSCLQVVLEFSVMLKFYKANLCLKYPITLNAFCHRIIKWKKHVFWRDRSLYKFPLRDLEQLIHSISLNIIIFTNCALPYRDWGKDCIKWQKYLIWHLIPKKHSVNGAIPIILNKMFKWSFPFIPTLSYSTTNHTHK